MKIIVMVLLSFGTLIGSSFAQAPEKSVEESLDALVDRLPESNGSPRFRGYVIGMKEGKKVLAKGYGIKGETPPSSSDVFAIGSVTKHIVALEILKLESQGYLKTSDTLDKYFRHLPDWANKVTIMQLANHTAGFGNYTSNPKFEKVKFDTLGLSDILALSSIEAPTNEPGTKWAYSNTHYYILGVIIEKVRGSKYLTQIKKDLFTNKNLKEVNTYVKRKMLKGYQPSPKGLVAVPLPNSSGPSSAGEIAMSPEEAIQWAGYVANLDPKTLEKFTKGSVAKPTYGMGIFTAKDSSWIHHGGVIDGFQTYFSVDPLTKSAVIVLGNCIGCGAKLVGKWTKEWIEKGVLPELPGIPQSLDKKTQKAFVGSYILDKESQDKVSKISKPLLDMVKSVELREKGEDLELDLIGQPAFLLKSLDKVIHGPTGITIDGMKIKKGKTKSFFLNQGSLKIRYLRKK